jgi:hypothetical protein
MSTSLPTTIAGIEIPDTALVRATTEFIRNADDDLLFDHSRRASSSALSKAAAGD